MVEAVDDPKVRPGVVAVPQTFGSLINAHPHIHCLASRGVWDDQARWTPIAYLDTHAAEKLFAHKILHLLQAKGLLSQERIALLTSFRNSGFSVNASPTVWPSDTQGIERLSRYLLRCPVSLSRIHWTPGARTLFYEGKASQDEPFGNHPDGDTLDIFEFIARILTQIPEPRQHGVHYFGFYSSRARALRQDDRPKLRPSSSNKPGQPTDAPKLSAEQRAALRKRWANLIRRVYKADPLICECGGRLRIISFITNAVTCCL